MITRVNTGWELYVYFNGTLIYKRWLKNGQKSGLMFYGGEGLTQFVKR